jgi:hypothetical protein
MLDCKDFDPVETNNKILNMIDGNHNDVTRKNSKPKKTGSE